MFFKWITFDSSNANCAPSILNMFINMMLFKRSTPPPNCEEFMFEGQGTVQMIFICVALICIPWMLLGKPLYIMCTRKSHHQVSFQKRFHYLDLCIASIRIKKTENRDRSVNRSTVSYLNGKILEICGSNKIFLSI